MEKSYKMIEFNLTLIVLILLVVISLIDFRTKQVPAFFTTAIILAILLVNMVDAEFGLIHIAFGIISFTFAYLLYESNFIQGIADIKVITIIGMMVSTLPYLFLFFLLTMILGIIYMAFWRYGLNYPEKSEIPFIPSLFCVYVILFAIGGLI